MPESNNIPQWAPKVPRNRIQRLYELDAQGILDVELIDEVGWALWDRCDSILIVTAAHHGHVLCPDCGTVIERRRPWPKEEPVRCRKCGWQISWALYHQTYRGRQLFGANAVELFKSYHDAFPQAQTANEKMLLIDGLLHAFHTRLQEVGRPAAANLIEGNLREVIRFLDGLAGSEAGAAGLKDSHDAWRRTLESADWSRSLLDRDDPGEETSPG